MLPYTKAGFRYKCLFLLQNAGPQVKCLCTKTKYNSDSSNFFKSGKRLEVDCNRSVGYRPLISKKPRLIAQITSFSKNSAPRLPIKIYDVPFYALFDTCAARSLLHVNIFNEIVSEQINLSDKTKSLSSHQLICTESDVDLYDIHNKPLLTKGINGS